MEFYDYLTEFIFVKDQPQKADIIFIPGGAYGEIAENAARLYDEGYAPKILVSGRYSILTGHFSGALTPLVYRSRSYSTECEFLSDVLSDNHIPADVILKEEHSTYTYENALFAKTLADQEGLSIKTAILSCQAYHAKRCLLYYQLVFPETRFFVCPAVTRDISRENWPEDSEKIDLVLGEVERCGNQFHDILKNRLNHDIL